MPSPGCSNYSLELSSSTTLPLPIYFHLTSFLSVYLPKPHIRSPPRNKYLHHLSALGKRQEHPPDQFNPRQMSPSSY